MPYLCTAVLLSLLILPGCLSKTPPSVIDPEPVDTKTPIHQQAHLNHEFPELDLSNQGHKQQLDNDLNSNHSFFFDNYDDIESLNRDSLSEIKMLQADVLLLGDGAEDTKALQEPVYDFPVVENDRVRYFIDYYSGRAKKTFTLWLERSSRYLPMMQKIFAEEGLPRDLAYLAMIESGFNDKAYSWAHAVGPWQFIAGTAKRYGLQNDWWHDERRDPEKATRAAARFLVDLHKYFDGDWYLAVASYNAGPGKIRNAIKRYKTRDFWELCRGKYLKTETKNYIPKLLAALIIAKQPEKYGIVDIDYQKPLEYDTVNLPSSTDLEVIARLTESKYDNIKQLNPELKRWCTPPQRDDYQVRLPTGTKHLFLPRYAELPREKRANYLRHKVKSGDTLLALSHRYGVRVQDIKNINRINNARTIQIGTNLIVPLNPEAKGSKPLSELKDDYIRSRKTFYTVRQGDSLWKISRKFGVTEQKLRIWNKLGWTNVIRPGQRLVVSPRRVSQQVAVATKSKGLKKVIYKVRPGDTLWAIGREFSVDAVQIRAWNNLADNHVLQPGENLTLHVSNKNRG